MPRARLPLALAVCGVATSAALTTAAPALADPPPVVDAGASTTYLLPGPGAYPEGIGVFGDTFYVGATSDGTLYRGSVDGGAVQVLSPGGADGRTTAIGIKATADRLYVAGGRTGRVFVYDRRSGVLLASFSNGAGAGQTFLNDIAIAPDGSAYVTDSFQPFLYRIPADLSSDGGRLEVAVDFRGTAFVYGPGFNANGIAITPDGRTAYVVQSATGTLFAVRLKDRGEQQVREVEVTDADGEDYALLAGDGLLLQGDVLRVLQNRQNVLTSVELAPNRKSGVVVSRVTDETFDVPTTLAAAGGRLLVVNAQFGDTAPEQPFTVSSIPTP